MYSYLFSGNVTPERAQISLRRQLALTHIGNGISCSAAINIELNQIAVWVDSDNQWDILDLRNLVKTLISSQLAMIGYIRGYVYDFEISRMINRTLDIDHVFGIDVGCIANRRQDITSELLAELGEVTAGPLGVYINRCFSDLTSALKHADDTGFYCYRAIEALRNHHTLKTEGKQLDKKAQWEAFRSVVDISVEDLRDVKADADVLRHGGYTPLTGRARAALLTKTWDIVDSYLDAISPRSKPAA